MLQIVGIVVVVGLVALLVVMRKREKAASAKPSRGSSRI
jgi:hypothetical protein